jgi:hypothetical protein
MVQKGKSKINANGKVHIGTTSEMDVLRFAPKFKVFKT